MAKTRGELQKEYLANKKKEVALQEKILRYEKEGIEVTGDMRRELSDLKKESADTKKVLVDMWTKGTKANQEAKEAADDYIVSVGKNLADAAKKGGKAQTKAFEKTSGQWTELIAARQKASDAGQDTSQFDALINAGQEFLSQTEMSADQVEEFQKKLGDIDISGLGDGAEDLVGSLTKGSKALGFKSTIMDGLNLKALTLSAVMTAVADQIGDALESAQKFTDELGVSASRARQMEFSFKNLGLSLLGFRNDFQLAEVAAAKTFGSLQAAENSKLTDRMALISKTMGITADQAAELTFTMTNLTGLSQEQAAATVEAAGKMAELNDVAPSAVLADMADSAGVLAKFSDGTAEGMARAAIQAQKLGINLTKAGQVADSLLELESSMTSEMEASVLLGRDINLDRARQLALNNDIEGAMDAVLDQLGSEEEFNKLNAIQRQALADSIGVGVEDLANMVNRDGAVEEAMPKAVSKTEFQILKELMMQNGFLGGIFKAIASGIAGFAGFKMVKDIFKLGFKDGMKMFGKTMISGLKNTFKTIMSPIARVFNFMKPIFSKLSAVLAPLMDIGQVFFGGSDKSKGAGAAGMTGGAIGAAIGTIIPGIGTAIGYAIGSIIGRITNFFFPQVGETIMSFAGKVKIFFLEAISGIADFGKNIGSTISGAVGKTVDVAKNLGSKAMEIGGTVVSTVFNALKFIHVDLPRKLGLMIIDTGKAIIDAILTPLTSVFNTVVEKIKSIMDFDIVGGAKNLASSALSAINPFDDFVQRPGQAPTAFSPQDTIIGVKDPSKLGGGAVNMAPVTNELSKHTTLLTEISANTRRTADAISKLQITSGA